MEPETPSRRTQSGEEPVTIDLEAVRAAEEGPPEEPPQEAAAAPADAPDTRQEEVAAAEEPAAAVGDPEPEPVQPAAAPPPQRSNAGAFAAGILGGLIALLGAGSLQYGGYLPSLGPQGGGDDGQVAALSSEVTALKTQLSEAATPAAVDLQPFEARIAALEEARPSATAPADSEALGRVESELAALRETLARTTETLGATESRLTERIAAAEEKLEEPRGDIEMARAVAASALKTAIDRGGPYLAELEAFASVSPDDPALAGLREHAAVGVAARSDLVRDFPAVADAILDAVHQPEGDQGILNRLMSSATSMIRVRPVGSVEGDTPEAVVARIETKLQNGDFKGAQIEWQTLPEAGQAAGAAYKRALDERVAVEALIGGVVSGAMAGGGNQG